MGNPRRIMVWVLLAVICGYWWWTQNTLTAPRTSNTHHPLLTLSNTTTYLYARDGQRISSLQAESARHHDDARGTELTHPVLNHQDESTTHYRAVARHGFINHAKDTLTLRDNVVVERFAEGQLIDRLNSESLTYRPLLKEIRTADRLSFTTPDSRSEATGALWRLQTNSLILEKKIRTHYDQTTPRH